MTPEDYLDSLPEPAQADLVALDLQIAKIMSGLERVIWKGKFWGGTDQNIIGYGDYTQKNRGGNVVNWFMVGLAMQKNYISVYVNAVEDNQYLTQRYADRLGKAKVGKSSVSFTKLENVNLAALLEMIAKARNLTSAEKQL